MDSFKSLVFRFAILASIIVMTNAAPWPVYARHPTHRIRTIGKRRTQVVTFQPKPLYKTFGASGIDDGNTVSPNQPWSLNDSVVSFVQSQLGIGPSEIGWKSGYSDDVAHYAFVKQHYDGIPFANAVANVAYNKNNKVVSFGSSFVNATSIAPSQPTVSFESVLPYIEELLGGQFNNHPPSLEYLVRPDMSVALTHVLQIQNTTDGTWYEAYICAHTGQLLSVNDFVAHASYTALPIQKLSVADGLEALTDPGDTISSPLGWNSDGSVNITVTSGNNVIAFKNVKSDSQQTSNQSSAVLNFQYRYNSSVDVTDPNNIDASRVNGFYVANMVHDIAYKYGFTEDAFNFQFDNLGRGGSNAKDGDGVLLSIQDASGTNNANFATPPDGQSGICRMFIWDLLSPRRDGAMENDIVVHEMTHGITNRMTGGGTGRCLQSTEAAGLGEGWSDAMADWMQQKGATIADFAIGQYVTGNSHGVRHHPYSTDPNVNPLRYSDLQMTTDPHSVGEIWANMLHNVLAALVQERGFSTQALTNPDGPEGNVVFIHLFIDGLALQPCNPTFVAARDAWIQADQTRFQGIHRCTLYSAFASRGLGSNAGDDFVDDDSVPADCFR